MIDFKKIIEIKYQEIPLTSIYFTKKTFLWCLIRYKGHPKGCPNYNSKLCPPNSPYLENNKQFCSFKHYYLIYLKFDFKNYIKEKRKEHPEWTLGQLGNKRHWQSSLKAKLKEFIINTLKKNKITYEDRIYILGCGSGFKSKNITSFQRIIYSMEAVGIYVNKTFKNNDIISELKPSYESIIHLVCLVCSEKALNFKENQKSLLDYITNK